MAQQFHQSEPAAQICKARSCNHQGLTGPAHTQKLQKNLQLAGDILVHLRCRDHLESLETPKSTGSRATSQQLQQQLHMGDDSAPSTPIAAAHAPVRTPCFRSLYRRMGNTAAALVMPSHLSFIALHELVTFPPPRDPQQIDLADAACNLGPVGGLAKRLWASCARPVCQVSAKACALLCAAFTVSSQLLRKAAYQTFGSCACRFTF